MTTLKQQPLALPAPGAGGELSEGTGKELVPVRGKESAPLEELKEGDDKLNARAYNELMDAYSLHQFIIRKGKTIETTPEFISYKRTYATRWSEITLVVHALEKLLSEYNVPLAYVDGKKAARLATDPFKKWTVDDLLNCIVNQDTVLVHVKIPGRRFAGPNGKELAATFISKTWKMYKLKKQFKFMRMFNAAARKITTAYKLYKTARQFKEKITQKYKEELVPSLHVGRRCGSR